MKAGYAFQWKGTNWRAAREWGIVLYTPDGTERRVGSRWIDGSPCFVFRCSDGFYRAQQTHYCS